MATSTITKSLAGDISSLNDALANYALKTDLAEYTTQSDTTSTTSGTEKALATVTLAAGTYLVSAFTRIRRSSANAFLQMSFWRSGDFVFRQSVGGNTEWVALSGSGLLKITSQQTYSLLYTQSTGSAADIEWVLRTVKLSV